MLTLTNEKADEIIAALSSAEELLLTLPDENVRYGVVAGQCAIAKLYIATAMRGPRFAHTYCSQCGCELGPGDAGVSHCSDHADPVRHIRIVGDAR